MTQSTPGPTLPAFGTRDPDLLKVGDALRRAATNAQELARRTGTPC